MNLSNWQASSYSGTQKPHQLGTGPISSQNLLVGMNALICTDPYQIWLRKWTGVCKTSYRPVCSAWYQTGHEHHCQRTVGLPLLGGDSALMMGDICRYQMLGGFTSLSCMGERLGNLTDCFLAFMALCSVSLQQRASPWTPTQLYQWSQCPTFKWLLSGLLINCCDISY